jgi:hypothetical protein
MRVCRGWCACDTTEGMLICHPLSLLLAVLVLSLPLLSADPLPRLRVADNQRFVVTEGGEPFFWLGDTAWELFHRLKRDEVIRYLDNRKEKGFTVVQAVGLAELDGLTVPSAEGGYLPLDGQDPARPLTRPGEGNDYWDWVSEVIDLAAERGLYVAFVPTWGKYVTSHWSNGEVNGIFDERNAEVFGRFVGERFKDKTNVVWVIGGDRAAPTEEAKSIWRAMARGVAIGVTGREDYSQLLMTYHTSGPGYASDFFHEDEWLDFTSIQSSHGDCIENYTMLDRDWARQPKKPIIDLESSYPDLLIGITGCENKSDDNDARRVAWWGVMHGAFGHTYGHNAVWQMHAPQWKPVAGVTRYWYDSLDAESASQMAHLHRLIASRPMLERRPAQEMVFGAGEGMGHIAASRGGNYAFVYTPLGRPITLQLGMLRGATLSVRWLNPRSGEVTTAESVPNSGVRQFVPQPKVAGQ